MGVFIALFPFPSRLWNSAGQRCSKQVNCKEKEKDMEEEYEDSRLNIMYGVYLEFDSNKMKKMVMRQLAKFNTEWMFY